MHERGAPAVPFLIRLLGDPRYDIQVIARDALVAIGEPAVEPCIAEATASDPETRPSGGSDPKARRNYAISCLGELKYRFPEVLDTLLLLLESEEYDVRRRALGAVDGCNDPRFTLPLIEFFGDPDREIRELATRCFCTLRDPRAVEPLIRTARSIHVFDKLYERSMEHRAAITALGCQGDPRAIPVLQEILRASWKDDFDRSEAAIALGRIGDPSVLPPLCELASNERIPVQARAGIAHAIAMFPDEEIAGTALGRMLSNGPFKLQIEVVQAMAEYGDPKFVDSLLSLSKRHGTNELAFWAAISAVRLSGGAIGDIDAVRTIRDAYFSFDGEPLYVEEKREALKMVAENGTSRRVRFAAGSWKDEEVPFAVPVTIGVVVCGAIVVWHIWRRRHQLKTMVEPHGDNT